MSEKFAWRSPLAFLFGEQTEWGECDNAAIAEFVLGESEAAATCAGVCDLSPLPRAGAIGACPETPPVNTAKAAANGALLCRLGEEEMLMLPAPDGATTKMISNPRLLIPRRDSHCQIGLCGARAAEVLARLCAVPPPQFPALLQTRAADISAIIVPEPRMTTAAFYLLAESAYAEHLWNAAAQTAQKLGGGVCGRKQWRALMQKTPAKKSAPKKTAAAKPKSKP